MESSPTLQDFVLNLIYDPGARSAFELDPHGTLEAAGLGDISAADVRDVLPLVLDYAPLGAVPTLDGLSQVDDATTGVAHLDLAGAVAHLQAITGQLGGVSSHPVGDLSIAAAGTVTVTADDLVHGVVHTGGGLTGGIFGHADAGLDVTHDLAASLDASVTAPVQHTVTDVTLGSDGIVSHAGVTGTLDGTVSSVSGLTGSLGAGVGIGDLDVSGVHEAASSLAGSLSGSDVTGGLLPDGTGVHDATAAIDHHVASVTGLTDGLTHGAAEPATDAGHDLLGGLTGLHF